MKSVTSINGWVKHPEGWKFVRSEILGSFYLLLYCKGNQLLRVIYNQDGRPVFQESWVVEVKRKEATWLKMILKKLRGN